MTLRAGPPLTETVPFQPASQATERITTDAVGARTRISSDLVLLESTCTGTSCPARVTALIGFGARTDVKTAYPCEKPATRHAPGRSADERDPPSS